jgi:outer membrane protein OmpA-like peptidoglycan-associated protein
VVGHTDNQGTLAYNLDLSKRRAAAVVKALVRQHGIAAGRLEGHGVGFLAPVAPNDSEPNRAKNRRVELVKR